MARSRPIDLLTKVFIFTAFLNFLVGAFLGGWMADNSALAGQLAPLHAEINPFGWLTMMIYGMTYAVLTLATGFRPPRAVLGWLHWLAAEFGVIAIVMSSLLQNHLFLSLGLGLQAIAPVIFLGNLLFAVIAGKKTGRKFPQDELGVSTPLFPLKRSETLQASDRVGQRGTDLALILYVIAVWWMWILSFTSGGATDILGPDAVRVLVYYGWIGGTVWSVGLHLLPRMAAVKHFNERAASLGQGLWFGAVILQALGTLVNPNWSVVTGRLLGIAALYQAMLFLWPLFLKARISSNNPLMPEWSRVAWEVALWFAALLGLFLLLGLDPLSLLALHMLFLGFATTLVYGVGYGLLPWFLEGVKVRSAYAWLQLLLSLVGTALMVTAFITYAWPQVGNWPTTALLSWGGSMAALGAFAFLLQWPVLSRMKQ